MVMRIPVTQMSNEVLLRQLLDAIPSYVFLVDKDVTILDYNAAAGAFLGIGRRRILRHRGGDVFHCLHSRDVTAGCGRGPFCKDCLVRGAVNEAFAGKKMRPAPGAHGTVFRAQSQASARPAHRLSL